MLIDLTVQVTERMHEAVLKSEKMASFGHLGTHFDVMDKEFPLAFVRRDGIVFDVSGIRDRDIGVDDIDLSLVRPGLFVALHSGHEAATGYGSEAYFKNPPQLAVALIDALLAREIAIIGIDFPGMRRGVEHTPMDQRCADRGVFVVENLCQLSRVLACRHTRSFVANTYPIHFTGLTGLPCRVVAETGDPDDHSSKI